MANNYLHMAKLTAQATVYKFYQAIVGKLGPNYLRVSDEEDTNQNLENNRRERIF
jgi:hypothetical protein